MRKCNINNWRLVYFTWNTVVYQAVIQTLVGIELDSLLCEPYAPKLHHSALTWLAKCKGISTKVMSFDLKDSNKKFILEHLAPKLKHQKLDKHILAGKTTKQEGACSEK